MPWAQSAEEHSWSEQGRWLIIFVGDVEAVCLVALSSALSGALGYVWPDAAENRFGLLFGECFGSMSPVVGSAWTSRLSVSAVERGFTGENQRRTCRSRDVQSLVLFVG